MKTGFSFLLMIMTVFAAPTVGQDKLDFRTDVLPILEKSCASCHKTAYKDDRGRLRKPKGGLVLDSAGAILLGGDEGRVIVPGYPEKSPLYTRTTLPEDHDDIMPAKGDVLKKAETDIIQRWIKEGGSFGGWSGNAPSGATPVVARASTENSTSKGVSRFEFLEVLSSGVTRPAEATIQKVGRGDARIRPVQPQLSLVSVDFVSNEQSVDDKRVTALDPLTRCITDLNLAKTRITDRALGTIARMSRLTRLDLHDTEITDRGLAKLAGLKELRYLNLYGTDVTDKGLEALKDLPNLEAVYLWQTKVTASGVAMLQKIRPGLRISSKLLAPEVRAPENNGDGRRRRGQQQKKNKKN